MIGPVPVITCPVTTYAPRHPVEIRGHKIHEPTQDNTMSLVSLAFSISPKSRQTATRWQILEVYFASQIEGSESSGVQPLVRGSPAQPRAFKMD